MRKSKAGMQLPSERTCREITELLADYIAGRLSVARKRNLERHLRICPDCVSFLNTYRQTVRATRSLSIDAIPPAVRENVRDFLRRNRARPRRTS